MGLAASAWHIVEAIWCRHVGKNFSSAVLDLSMVIDTSTELQRSLISGGPANGQRDERESSHANR